MVTSASQADGRMLPVDHVIDELGTRFQSVTAMEAVTIDGRSFIVVGGADDGLSLLTLTADGRLLHLATIADTAQLALADVSSISASVVDGRISGAPSTLASIGIGPYAGC